MKQIFNIALSLFSLMTSAQVSIAAKANLLFPTSKPSWSNIYTTATNVYSEQGKNNVGFNAGLSFKFSFPNSFFLMPEIYYTTFSNKFTDPTTNTTIEAKSNRADLPVLLGYKVLGDKIGFFAGPVASYNLSKDNQYNDFQENAKNQFTVGYQFGAQLEIKNLILNARYEGAFTKDEREYISQISPNTSIRYDNRPSLLIVGAGLKF